MLVCMNEAETYSATRTNAHTQQQIHPPVIWKSLLKIANQDLKTFEIVL